MRRLIVGIIAAAALSVTASVPRAATLYVDADRPAGGDGQSWNDAFRYLQDALIAAAVPEIEEVRVARGTYRPDEDTAAPGGSGDRTATFQMLNGVALRGGFAGFGEIDPDARDVAAFETILSGDLAEDDAPGFVNTGENSLHVVTGTGNDASAVLEGFTISGGNADGASFPDFAGGGLILGSGSSPVIRQCTFTANQAVRGGGIMGRFGSTDYTVIDSIFVGNQAELGGGMFNEGSADPTVIGCRFLGNIATQSGGGMGNFDGSRPLVINSIFSGNAALMTGGGMWNFISADPDILHCSFTGNTAVTDGGGMYNNSGADPRITSCIAYDNTDGDGQDRHAQVWNQGSGAPIISHSVIQGGWPGGTSIVDADPLFVNAAGTDAIAGTLDDDLHLAVGSPARDAGKDTGVPTNLGQPYAGDPCTDLEGILRILDSNGDGVVAVDIGAYEHDGRVTVPGEVAGLRWTDGQTLIWDPEPAAVEYHVYRGELSTLEYGSFGACRDDLDGSATDTVLVDDEIPPADDAFFYVITADAAATEGTLGTAECAERDVEPGCASF
ncbi:MAG: right-handed parallel beta-helix repeat-containing protein [bacterium]|nr:right-handed parallel beta-helix repeat-containing protein [bacterium]